jgi:hypothetical protein
VNRDTAIVAHDVIEILIAARLADAELVASHNRGSLK